jgi:hypothetical protein
MISCFCTNTQVDLTTSHALSFGKKTETRVSLENEKRNDSAQANGLIFSEPRSNLEAEVEDSIRSSDSETDISGTLSIVPDNANNGTWDAIKGLSDDWEPSVVVSI